MNGVITLKHFLILTIQKFPFFMKKSSTEDKLKIIEDKLPSSTTSMCIYRFDCSCGASYLGRIARHLSKRIAEHHPAWLGKGVVKSIRSSIVEHLVDTGHQVSVQNAFSVYYKIPANLPQSIKLRQLCIAKAVAIKKLKPALCVQKGFVRTLLLTWPEMRS